MRPRYDIMTVGCMKAFGMAFWDGAVKSSYHTGSCLSVQLDRWLPTYIDSLNHQKQISVRLR